MRNKQKVNNYKKMITLSQIKNKNDAAKYYIVEDNYYLAETDAKDVSEWWGKGAAELGLKGRVEEKDLQMQIDGILPNGVIIGLQKDGKINHRAGYDITFHAPKSVSILALEANDKRFYNAHLEAVKETLELIEKDCAQVKVLNEGKLVFQKTQNLSIALMKHNISRELDPQLHHHALVMNVTKRSDGKWRALASNKKNSGEVNGFFEQVYKNQICYGLIYKTSLANKVIELGCEIESVGPHGLWEIKGVPKEARELLSKRRKQIEEQLSKLHYKSPKAADVASYVTREMKTKDINLDDLREVWKNELNSIGFSSKEFIPKLSDKVQSRRLQESSVDYAHNKNHTFNEEHINPNAKIAIENALAHLSEYSLKLEYGKIISQALEFAIGKVTHKEVIEALNEATKEGILIPIDQSGFLYVTKELLDTEKNIMGFVTRGKGVKNAMLLKPKVLEQIEDGGDLKQCLTDTLLSQDRFTLVESSATDNTKFIAGILNLAEASGKTVRILSPNRATALDVNENIKRKPNSIWQWFLSLGKPELGESVAGFKHKYTKELDEPLSFLREDKDVILIHDAESLGAKDVVSLSALTERSKARTIFLRNVGYRSSMSAGNAMTTLKQAGIATITLKDDGQNKNITPTLTVIKDNNERTKTLARTYAEKEDKDRNNTKVLVNSKEQIKETSLSIRKELKRLGKLSNSELTIKTLAPIYMSKPESELAHRYQKNQLVRFYNTGASVEVWRIESINKEDNLIRLAKNSKRILWNPKENNTNYSLFKEEELNIAKGDRLIATGNMNHLEIKNRAKFTVSDIGQNYIKLLGAGKTLKVSLKGLHNGHLDYDYVTTLGRRVKKGTAHILADFKAYSLDKATLNELTRLTKDTLTIFTNDQKLAEKRLGYDSISLTAAETLFKAQGPSLAKREIDRLINDNTIQELKGDIEKAAIILKERYLQAESKSLENKAVDFALEKITSRSAGFTHEELVTEALTYALRNKALSGNSVTNKDILKVINEKSASGELIMGKHFTDGARWTTKELLELERSIIEGVSQGKNKYEPLMTNEAITKYLDKISKEISLTKDQKNACHLIASAKDKFVMIQGYAGTGKTTIFRYLQEMLKENAATLKLEGDTTQAEQQSPGKNSEPIKILGIAPTHGAVDELKAIGLEAQTLESFIIEEKQWVTDSNINQKHSKLNNYLIILDEASMVSNRDYKEFSDIVNAVNSRAVLSGDIAQYPSIESGKPLEVTQRSNVVNTACLKEVIRQHTPSLKEAVNDVIGGNFKEAFGKIANENPQDHIKRERETPFLAMLKNSIVEVDNNKLKDGEKTLEELTAEDYLTRVPDIRNNTVVIVHSNQDRKVINEHIRHGLKQEGTIAQNGAKIDCLISTNLTSAECKQLNFYQVGDVVKLGKKYYHVIENDSDTKSVLLKDEANNTKLFYPEKDAGKYKPEIYEKIKNELSAGDTIRLTKTDKSRKLYANTKYTVSEVSENKLALKKVGDNNVNEPLIVLNPKELKDAHWDYAYTVTGYSIQGGSKLYVIDFEVSYRKNLANQRSFYIGASRAIIHLVIYTDNKERLLYRILTNKGDKLSSLEVNGDLNDLKDIKDLSSTSSKSSQATEVKNSKSIGIKDKSFDSNTIKEVESLLNIQAEYFVESLLGAPNPKLSSQTEWRYGRKGSFVISMGGDKRGFWHSFQTEESGNLIKLIQKETGLSFKDTLKYVIDKVGKCIYKGDKNYNKPNIKNEQADQKLDGEKKEKNNKTSEYAKKLYKESMPISRTIVEKYLKNTRGISNIDIKDLRYHPKVYIGNSAKGKRAKDRYAPAMLAIGRDKNNNIQCVQATYLDPKIANKANFDVKKRTYSSPSGAAVSLTDNKGRILDLNKQNKNKITYIAEGVETGLSIKDADKNTHIMVVLGKSNFATIDPDMVGNKVIFCLDNDGNKSLAEPLLHRAMQRIIEHGKEVFVTIPNQINGNKTDFNDVLKTNGIGEVKRQINNVIPYIKFAKNHPIEPSVNKNIMQKSNSIDHNIANNSNNISNQAQKNIKKDINTDIKIIPNKQIELEL